MCIHVKRMVISGNPSGHFLMVRHHGHKMVALVIYLRLSHTLYPMKYVHVVNVICCYISYLSVLSGFMTTRILQGHYTGNSSSTSVEILNNIGKIRQKLKTSKFNDTLVKYNNIPLGKFILKCFSFVLASVSKDENIFENEWHMVPLRDNSNCCVTQTLW